MHGRREKSLPQVPPGVINVSLVKQGPLGRYGADAPMRPGTATITQIPKLVECSPIAALIPQAKESGGSCKIKCVIKKLI